MNNGKNDLTEGSIGRKLISFFLPIAAGTLFQQLYNAADAIVVGKFVGTIALAAVGGSAANITNLLIGFFVALSGGSTVVIAQLFGAKDEESIQKATGTAVAFCIISGIVLTVVGIIFAPFFLRVLQTPADTISEATTYLRIVFLGVTAQLLYNIEAGVFNAVGDSRSPFIYLSICCIVNIFLDLLLVAIFKMGVAGAAIATIASQIMSAVLATAKLMRSKEAYRITLKGIGLHRKLLGRIGNRVVEPFERRRTFAREFRIERRASDAHAEGLVDARQRLPAITARHDVLEVPTQADRLMIVDHHERLAVGQPVEAAEDDGATIHARQSAHVEFEIPGGNVSHAVSPLGLCPIIGMTRPRHFAPAQTGEKFSSIRGTEMDTGARPRWDPTRKHH